MAQGKLKAKSKQPVPGKSKANNSQKNKDTKSKQIQRRGKAPVRPKKAKVEEQRKLKTMITKTVNKAMEKELRQKVLGGKQSLTKRKPPVKPKQITITIN